MLRTQCIPHRLLAGMLAAVVLAEVTEAAVQTIARWRGGEDDLPAPSGAFGPANNTAQDGTGRGHNLTKGNSTGAGPYFAYSGDYPPGVGLPAGSAVDYAFDATANNVFNAPAPVPTPIINWGVQLWVRPNTANSGQVYIENGSTDGFALFQLDASLLGQGSGVQYYAEVFGVVDLPSGVTVDTSAWRNLALVNDGGLNRFFVDGAEVNAFFGAALPPTGGIALGANTTGAHGGQFFGGGIDEARIFTFAPGAFNPATDLSLTPGPSSVRTLAAYRGGEDDPEAVAGATVTVATDPFTRTPYAISGAPTWSADTPLAESRLSVRFAEPSGVVAALTGGGDVPGIPADGDNWGIEGWVKLESYGDNSGVPFVVGQTGAGGGLGTGFNFALGEHWMAVHGGVTIFGNAPCPLGVWTHLAVVVQDGVKRLYVNKAPTLPTASGTVPPAAPLCVGADALQGQHPVQGLVDEVRVFTFDPGGFNPATDLQQIPAAPRFSITQVTLLTGPPRVRLKWNSLPGKVYRVEFSSNLAQWTPGTNVTDSAGAETTTEVPTAPGGAQQFYRVKESLPPAFDHVGFYTHGGWVFDYPLAPHSWQRADYAAMFGLLKRMGYDTVQIWPLLEAIPMPLTEADRAEVGGFRTIVQEGRDAGLKTWVAFCPNLTTYPSIGSVPWRQRNPYPVFRTIYFTNAQDSADYFAHRRALISILNNADGYVTIDGDPGGYEGAAAPDFVSIFQNDHESVSQFGTHPSQQEVIPWVWCGWGTKGVWAEPIEPFIRAELNLLPVQLPEPWSLLPGRSHRDGWANGRTNMRLIEEYDLASRSMLMFYEAIEFEPVPPSPTLRFADIRRIFREETSLQRKARGAMGNAQQPVMMLPNIFFFGRLARDLGYLAKSDDAVLNEFAAFLGGPAALLRPAWKCFDLGLAQISADLPAQLRATTLTGEPAAFIPGGPALYLDLIAAQVESRRRMLVAMTLPHATDTEAATAVAAGTDALVSWWKRHHFVFGNNPGTPFDWQFVHQSQYNAWAAWARANVANPQVVLPLAAQELVSRGALAEPTATAAVRQLLGL